MNRLESSQLARYEDRHASDHGGELRVDREERRVDVGLQEGGETVRQQLRFEVELKRKELTGAAPRKSILSYVPSGERTRANPPPPKPEWYEAIVPTQAAMATRLSAALPPLLKKEVPMSAHSWTSHAAAPV